MFINSKNSSLLTLLKANNNKNISSEVLLAIGDNK